jgi:murein DD-endopeptidase MepM/ murein hydrolase activator NlpD
MAWGLRMADDLRDEPTPENSGTTAPPAEAADGRDPGRLVALGAMATLVVLGLALMARGPRTPAAPPAAALLTNASVGASASAAAPAASESTDAALAVTTPTLVRDVDAGPRFVPAFRIASLKSAAAPGTPEIEIVEGTYGKRTLAAALAQVGVPRAEIKRVSRAFDGVHRIERAEARSPKDAFVLARDKAKGTIVGFEHVASPSEIWQARVDEASPDKRLVAKRLEVFVEQKRVSSAIAVSADLGKAIAAAGMHEGALEAIDDALEGHVDLSTIRPGVRLRVVADEEWVEGAFSRFHVEAIELVPKTGAAQRVYFYERDPNTNASRRHVPHPGFYDAKGQQPYKGLFRSPLPFARITSRFNPRRMHPVLHVVMPHNGIDFGASTGTPVYASATGTVKSAGNGGPCGNMVQIDHPNGLTTAYCHLSRFAAGLHAGQHVDARQLIGYVGQSGRATGPHLHFAVKRGGVFIDPQSLKMDGVRVLPPSDREIFAKQRAELDLVLDAIPLPPAVDAPEPPADKEEATGEE